jgi:hypothetical protein
MNCPLTMPIVHDLTPLCLPIFETVFGNMPVLPSFSLIIDSSLFSFKAAILSDGVTIFSFFSSRAGIHFLEMFKYIN